MKIDEITGNKSPKYIHFSDYDQWKYGVDKETNGQYKMEDDRIDDIKRVIKDGVIVGQWNGEENSGWITDFNYEYGRMTIAKLRNLFT